MKTNDTTDPLKNQEEPDRNAELKEKDKEKPEHDSGVAELMDDREEQAINASYDEIDDQLNSDHEEDDLAEGLQDSSETDLPEEHSGEEDEGQDNASEEELLVNFSLLSQEDLVKLMREKLDHPARGNLRRDVEGIRKAFFDRQEQLLEEKKQQFLEEGGNLEDFKPVEIPLEAEMKELLRKFREMRVEFGKQQEKSKQDNLKKKQEILEEFRMLMEGQESFEITFRRFKDLQRQWFAAGIVPHSYLKDLWDSYNYFVEKFNDYVRINRELRALDLKKNLELKIQLCEKTEALDQEENLVDAFKILQKHHIRWREIGPVPRENRDEVWDRFKAATSAINKKHQAHHARMKESLQENLEKKIALCEQVEAIAEKDYTNHGTWVDRTRQVLEIQKTWKTIGYAPKKDNNTIYARFRKACDIFFNKKAGFYALAYEEQKSNLDKKIEIIEKAEALKDSQDWKGTSSELIRLQKQWKEIGPVPKKHSDRIWKRFRSACDTFFNNKSRFFDDVDSTFDDNLKAKEALVIEMDNFEISDDRQKNLEALEEFHERFAEIGYVPSKKKEWIKEQFRHAEDRLLDRMGMDVAEQSIYRFRNRVQGILQSPRSEMKLNFERDKLVTKLQQLKGEIGTWENNIGFFKQSDPTDDTIQGFQEKIDTAHERIRMLELKIRILDDMENEN